MAGSGDDAAPYLGIINPLTQRKKFDPEGRYVSRWAPDALAPAHSEPMVDVKATRATAPSAYNDIKASASLWPDAPSRSGGPSG